MLIHKIFRLSLTLLLLFTTVFGQICSAAQDDIRLPQAAMDQDWQTVQSLLTTSEVDPNRRGQFETAALHWAVRFNEIETTRLLLKAGANPDLKTTNGSTALSLAVANENTVMLDLLLAAGANPNTTEFSGESILMSAAASGVLKNVKALINSGATLDAPEPNYGQTALMFAARAGHTNVVDFLLLEGANPNTSTSIGQTPRWVGANSVPGFGFGVGIIRGGVPADRGRRDPIPGGMTPLLYAARHNYSDIAQLLLDSGANLEQVEANNISPLLMAISNNQIETAYLLLEQGANINMADWYGRSPLWEAVNVRNLYVHNGTFTNDIEREPLLGLIQTLLKGGAAVDARTAETPPFRPYLLPITGSLEWVDFTGQTPFISAARAGDVSVMKLLLEYGADPHISTYEGSSALMAAAGINWVVAQTYTESPESLLAAVKLCWELGLDVNQTNTMGLAAVHGAANRGSDDIIRFLVSKGARLEGMLDNEGRSPLDWAAGVFLATHPAEPKPESMVLITELLDSHE